MMTKYYVLVAEAADGHYGNPLVDYKLFTEEQKEEINAKYMAWLNGTQSELDKYNRIIINDYVYDPFMLFLKKEMGFDMDFRAWDYVYWEEMSMYQQRGEEDGKGNDCYYYC